MKRMALTFFVVFFSLSAAMDAQSRKELKEQEKLEGYDRMKALVEFGKYSFEANAAFTQKGRRIDLTTNQNSLIIDGSNVDAYLPYFGVVQVPTFSGDAGIKFENGNTEFNIKYNDKKQNITIKFRANNKTENFNLTFIINSSGFTSLNVNSDKRNTISYHGRVEALKAKKEDR